MFNGLLRIRSYPSQRAGSVDQVVQGDCDGSAATTGWTFSEGHVFPRGNTLLSFPWLTYPLCHFLVASPDKGRLQVGSKTVTRQLDTTVEHMEHHRTPMKCRIVQLLSRLFKIFQVSLGLCTQWAQVTYETL